MTLTPSPADVVSRLSAVDWADGGYDHTRSRARLMREYLRRAALWTRELGCREWPFPDIAAYADPAVRADAALVSGFAGSMKIHWPYLTDACLNAIHRVDYVSVDALPTLDPTWLDEMDGTPRP